MLCNYMLAYKNFDNPKSRYMGLDLGLCEVGSCTVDCACGDGSGTVGDGKRWRKNRRLRSSE